MLKIIIRARMVEVLVRADWSEMVTVIISKFQSFVFTVVAESALACRLSYGD